MLEAVSIANEKVTQNLFDGIVVLDSDHNIQNIDRAAVKIFGLQDRKIHNRSFPDLFAKQAELLKIMIAGLNEPLDHEVKLTISDKNLESQVKWKQSL